ncbi:MAG: hypothetical protein UV59_C0012G0067 [Candidatus Gottesmanbacteria bacterium GW2011_GWA1_43_11]|uniref:Plasmid stabilization system n=1 Tax=Candidatus Gottesmanbacteria bacterium GW2011_GWA1_43_11 TaxID=1618436 RepID=A0A0G1CHL5_9BACT|nr:MAG: hypothetical protein UV59_C0012G0067 [Candidatus Gottesmanbacteria bacterium GW2011_GWA1_43_11]
MIIESSLVFRKVFKKRIAGNEKLIRKFNLRLELFQQNPQHPLLHDHPLTGTKKGQRAFSITGDMRVVYQQVSEDVILLLDIGTHNQVY